MTAGETLGSVFPISVSFVQGEQPTSGKFSGWANQTSAGLNRVARAIGDIWGEEFEDNKLYVDWRRPPHIINLARLIGPASAINPLRPVAPSQRVEYDVVLDAADIPEGVNEFNLREDCSCEPPIDWSSGALYPLGSVEVHSSIHTALNAVNGTVFGALKTSRAAVAASGDYYVDTHGNVLTYDRTATGWTGTQTYQTTMTPDMYDQATLNVIPDMNQSSSDGLCDVLSSAEDTGIPAGEYVIRTPYLVKLPRRNSLNNPLIPGDTGCPPASFETTERARLPWVLKAADGMNLSDGDVIPDGFIGLWEDGVGMVAGLTFKLCNASPDEDEDPNGFNSNYCVIATGGTLDTNDIWEVADPTKGSTYRLVTVGTTITELLSYSIRRFDTHDHNDRQSGYPVEHLNLKDKTISPVDVLAKWSIEVGSPPSVILGNDHPQYLCRYGWKSSVDAGQYDNAMLGDLFMAAVTTDYVTDGYSGNVNSRAIYFSTTSNKMWYDFDSGGKLTIETSNYMIIDGSYGISLLSDGPIALTTTTVMNLLAETGGINIIAEGLDNDLTLKSDAGVKIGSGDSLPTANDRSIAIVADANSCVAGEESILLVAGSGVSDTSLAYEIRLKAQGDIVLDSDNDLSLTAAAQVVIGSTASSVTYISGSFHDFRGGTSSALVLPESFGAPAMIANGSIYYDTSTNAVMVRTNTGWHQIAP